jgi:hypothetical protein
VCALDATYLGQLYFGEVAAHFAIVHEDLPMLKLLVSHGASLTPRACGDFFYSNPLLYFGGTLLGFAACLDNKPMVEYLLNNEFTLANPNGKDQGQRSQRACATKAPGSPQVHMHRDNTILHCLVLHERAHMYRYLVEHGANTYSPNSVNQTPMLLAVAKGSKRMVSTAIEATQILRWTFGPVKCVEVPLYEVESVKEAKLIAEEGTGKDRGTWMTWLEGKGGSGAGSQPVGADRSEQTKTILQLIDRPEQSDLLCTPHAVVHSKQCCHLTLCMHVHRYIPDVFLPACLGRHRDSVEGCQGQMGLLCWLHLSLLCHSECDWPHLANARAVHGTRGRPLHWSRLPFRGARTDRRYASHNRRCGVRDNAAVIAFSALS